MKVIFLDFDGVINNWNCSNLIDAHSVDILKLIQKKTGAQIVATTSNKYSFQRASAIPYEKTKYYKYVIELERFGVKIDAITSYSEDENREQEINAYLEVHPDIEQFVILDDDFVGHSLKEHQVYLDLYNGLQIEHIVPILQILSGNLGFYPADYDINETPEQRNIRINQYHNKTDKKTLK